MANRTTEQTDVAIIGIAGLFSGCKDKDAYWDNIVRKVDNIKIAPDSWAKPWYDPELAGKELDSGRIRTLKVGLLGDLATFDINITPADQVTIDWSLGDGTLASGLPESSLATATTRIEVT